MAEFWPRLRFYWVFFGMGVSTLFHGAMFYLLGFIFPRFVYRLMQAYMQTWADLAGARIYVSGLMRPNWEEPSVIVGNHLSYLDIPAAVQTAPVHIHFIATRGLARIPIFGAGMRMLQMVFIDRKSSSRAYQAIDEAARKIAQGRHLLSYPEGGISRDGRMGDFKKGLFRLAIRAGVPITPVVIRGSGAVLDCIAKKSRPGRVEVEYLSNISTREFTENRAGELADAVRERMLEAYGDGSLKGTGFELFKNHRDRQG